MSRELHARPSISPEGSLIPGDGRTIRSGIAPLDAHLGGIAAGRIHLLSGGVGAGKTSACLHFLAAGLRDGETAAILTLDEPAELGAHAAHLGIDLALPLRAGRLTALRFRPDFARRFAGSASYDRVLDDLRTMVSRDAPPARIAIDPLSPFLSDASPAGRGVAALVELLGSLGATALLTIGGPVTSAADRRLDPLIDRAATIMSIERDPEGEHRLEVSRARLVGAPGRALPFSIVPGGGAAAPQARVDGARERAPAGSEIRVRLLLDGTGEAAPPEDTLALLRREYDIAAEGSHDTGSRPSAPAGAAALLLWTHRDALAAAHERVRRMSGSSSCLPVIVMINGPHRSVDRARLMRSGADEVLPSDLSGPELLQRLAKVVGRGHRPVSASQIAAPPARPLELDVDLTPEVRVALQEALSTRPPPEPPTRFALMALTPRPGSAEASADPSALAEKLVSVVRGTIRDSDGDRAQVAGDAVVVFLHEAASGHAELVAERVRSVWRVEERGPLRVQRLSVAANDAAAAAAPGVGSAS